MKPLHRWWCVFALVLLAVVGCAAKAQHSTGPRNGARQDQLPSWAPQKPSPEFLHAAKLLKAIPSEAQPHSPEYVPCWELFGSLTDKQIAEFTTWKYESRTTSRTPKLLLDTMTKIGQAAVEGDRVVLAKRWVCVPIRSFSPRQRQLLDQYTAVCKGAGKRDLLADLYHAGAKQDLSNVELYFHGVGHLIVLSFQGHDKLFPHIGSVPFAQLRASAAPRFREKLGEKPLAK